jgi:uncharacterized protein
MNGELPVAESQDSKNIAMLIWVGTIFLSFVPGLIVYLVRKDDAFIVDQAKEALNWSITFIIGCVIGAVLTFLLVGALIKGLMVVINVIFCVMGALSCSNGNAFRAPFALRLIK